MSSFNGTYIIVKCGYILSADIKVRYIFVELKWFFLIYESHAHTHIDKGKYTFKNVTKLDYIKIYFVWL